MLRFLIKWFLSAIALMFLAYLLPGITLKSFGAALMATAIIGLLNAVVRPVLVLLTLPVTLVTLGLFLLIINALLFWLAGSVLAGFVVDGFWWAFTGAIAYSLLGMLIDTAVQRQHATRSPNFY